MDATESISNYFLNQLKDAGLYYESSLSDLILSAELLSIVSKENAAQYHILPIKHEEKLTLVTDTENTFKQKMQLEKILTQKIELILADEENVRLALLKFYDISNYAQEKTKQRTIEEDVTPLKASLNKLMQDAAKAHVSDIHILPASSGINIRFRIYGHMFDVSSNYEFAASQTASIISLIKQMDTSGNVDFMRTNMPNEGSFYLLHGKQDIFVRMETLPVGNEQEQFEKIDLRLLYPSTAKQLDAIGYTPEDLQAIKRVLFKNSTGLFINAGPTGAGKTTSLYSQIRYIISNLNEPLNVITIDDPIEIREESFTQVQVRKAPNEALNLTAGKIFNASLRSDPDIILYNEIRDDTDAKIAMQASSSGHKVFSTVHAADCVRAISRLLDLNVSKITLLSEIKLIITQRLVARLCPECSQEHQLTEQEKSILSEEEITLLNNSNLREIGTKEAAKACLNTECQYGLIGSTAVAEYVEFNMAIRDALINQRSFSEISLILEKNNFKTMWEKGLELVKNGEIELAELIRVVGKE